MDRSADRTLVRIRTSFYIAGDGLRFDEITACVNLKPSRTRKKEEFPIPRYGRDNWEYRLSEVYPVREYGDDFPYPDVMTQLGQMQALLEGRADAIREYCSTRNLDVSFVVASTSEDERQAMMDLPTDFIHFMSRLGARISFDLCVNAGSIQRSVSPRVPENWPRQDPNIGNCESVAREIQRQSGGEMLRITPKEGDYLGDSTNHIGRQPWSYHVVVVKDGRVFDGTTGPQGMLIADYKAMFKFAVDLSWGFEEVREDE